MPANGSASVSVTLKFSQATVAGMADAEASQCNPGGTCALNTARGLVLASPTASGTGLYQLRVPWLVAPRGTSNVKPTPTTLKFAAGSSKTLNLSNSGIHSGNADFYALGQTSSDNGMGAADLHANGVQVLPGAALGQPASDRRLIFAANTYGAWSNPAQIEDGHIHRHEQ